METQPQDSVDQQAPCSRENRNMYLCDFTQVCNKLLSRTELKEKSHDNPQDAGGHEARESPEQTHSLRPADMEI